ncbi:major facilitator superfamily MFS_1 [Pacificimonas flava]|uniref:Major facilitator superfamily MFS_1 n=2 Tax=Pacificimonas flava TaxID=1234595 RepID=M2U7P2_9SPHN|nr:major facilitator superfamily MFS_1 [Pacificimonas flava]
MPRAARRIAMFPLLGTRRFGPLFGVQFLGAFNDNLFRFGLLFLVTYRMLADSPEQAAQLVSVASGLFILPFVLFSGLAGQVADAVDKARAIRIIKFAEILIMAAGGIAIWLGSIPFMLAVLFAMGLQSTFFGPIKYAIVPQHLEGREITAGTALIEAGTYVAILSGQMAGGLVTPMMLMIGIMLVSCAGYVAALAVPSAPPAEAGGRVQANILASSWSVLQRVAQSRHLMLAALCGSWFWMIGIIFTSLFVPLVKNTLHASEGVANLFVAAFSIGVALGSLLVGRLQRGRVGAGPLAPALIVMAAASVDLYFAVNAFGGGDAELLMRPMDFLARGGGVRILLDLTLFAIAGGAFIVPTYAILMAYSEPAARAQTIAGYNIMNSAAMVVGALGAGALLSAGLGVSAVLLWTGLANLPVIGLALWLRRALPPREVV